MKAIGTSINNISVIKGIIIGIICAVSIIIILMCILAVVFLKTGNLPVSIISYVLIAIDGIGALIAGYISARIIKSRGLLYGCICGLIIFAIIFVGGFCTSDGTLSILTLCKAITLIICGALGGIKGVNTKDKIKIK